LSVLFYCLFAQVSLNIFNDIVDHICFPVYLTEVLLVVVVSVQEKGVRMKPNQLGLSLRCRIPKNYTKNVLLFNIRIKIRLVNFIVKSFVGKLKVLDIF
jgi:hypothetical protein